MFKEHNGARTMADILGILGIVVIVVGLGLAIIVGIANPRYPGNAFSLGVASVGVALWFYERSVNLRLQIDIAESLRLASQKARQQGAREERAQ